MERDRQSRAAYTRPLLHSPGFARNWRSMDEATHHVSQDEVDEQFDGPEWTCKYKKKEEAELISKLPNFRCV